MTTVAPASPVPEIVGVASFVTASDGAFQASPIGNVVSISIDSVATAAGLMLPTASICVAESAIVAFAARATFETSDHVPSGRT